MILPPVDIARLVPMDIFEGEEPLRVDLAYAGPRSFCGVLYRPGARLWLHEDLAAIVLLAARRCRAERGLRMILYDGLRTVTVQELMRDSAVVRAHPHWLEGETRVLSPPGAGGHPRAMAVDVSLETADGALLDMGTAFDELPRGGAGPETNRAHRLFGNLPEPVKNNRRVLEEAMTRAAAALGLPLLPLPVEWWDFRFPASHTGQFAPLADTGLPPQMRMTTLFMDAPGPADFPPAHFENLGTRLSLRLKTCIYE